MFSLDQLLRQHGSVAILDAASSRVHVGWLPSGATPAWAQAEEEAGTGLFRCIGRLPTEMPLAAGALVFCEGPGSVLGVRTAAVIVRMWRLLRSRPIYSFQSLELVAHHLRGHGERDLHVIADARRDSWHRVTLDSTGQVLPLTRTPSSELIGRSVMPAGFRAWTALPPETGACPYDVPALFAALPHSPLFREASDPDAFLHEAPAYVTWTPQIHRAPT